MSTNSGKAPVQPRFPELPRLPAPLTWNWMEGDLKIAWEYRRDKYCLLETYHRKLEFALHGKATGQAHAINVNYISAEDLAEINNIFVPPLVGYAKDSGLDISTSLLSEAITLTTKQTATGTASAMAEHLKLKAVVVEALKGKAVGAATHATPLAMTKIGGIALAGGLSLGVPPGALGHLALAGPVPALFPALEASIVALHTEGAAAAAMAGLDLAAFLSGQATMAVAEGTALTCLTGGLSEITFPFRMGLWAYNWKQMRQKKMQEKDQQNQRKLTEARKFQRDVEQFDKDMQKYMNDMENFVIWLNYVKCGDLISRTECSWTEVVMKSFLTWCLRRLYFEDLEVGQWFECWTSRVQGAGTARFREVLCQSKETFGVTEIARVWAQEISGQR
eukprot:Skav222720  [mRNA]  locus=scaffold4971:33265:36135:- [translate_table: standard]